MLRGKNVPKATIVGSSQTSKNYYAQLRYSVRLATPMI
jgi:hypothetical protein